MVRVITQETFDEVVRENVEDLDMTEEEAISSAVEQFKAQGVDMTNIILDPGAKDIFTKTLASIKSAVENSREDTEDVIENLNVLKTECNKGMSYRVLASKLGVYGILLDVIEAFHNNTSVRVAALNALTVLMTGYPDLLEPKGIEALMKCVEDKFFTEDPDTLCAALQWSHQCCIKDEKNRQALVHRGLADIVTRLFNKVAETDLSTSSPSYEPTIQVLADTCELVRVLVLDDDIRETVSRGHEHARSLAINNLSQLAGLLQKTKEDPRAASLVIGALSNLVVRNEFCETIDEAGGLEHLWDIMIEFPDDEKLNTQCLRLLKALAGNDRVKAHIVQRGFIPLIISAMRRYEKSQKVQSAGCNAVGALALRNPPACQLFVDNGAPEAIIQAMKQHVNVGIVQRPCCLAIRNIVARSKELNSEFLKLGVEELLNQIDKKVAGDEAKAALRDLGCHVKFSEPFTGEVGSKLAQ